jgi:hypothetical protein
VPSSTDDASVTAAADAGSSSPASRPSLTRVIGSAVAWSSLTAMLSMQECRNAGGLCHLLRACPTTHGIYTVLVTRPTDVRCAYELQSVVLHSRYALIDHLCCGFTQIKGAARVPASPAADRRRCGAGLSDPIGKLDEATPTMLATAIHSSCSALSMLRVPRHSNLSCMAMSLRT